MILALIQGATEHKDVEPVCFFAGVIIGFILGVIVMLGLYWLTGRRRG